MSYCPSHVPLNKKMVCLGLGLQHKRYRCLQPSTGRAYISKHVMFDENVFPFPSANSLHNNVLIPR